MFRRCRYIQLQTERAVFLQKLVVNILNGFNFAKKVIDTGECDVLVLDEVLGLVDLEIISIEDIISLITLRDDYCKLVMTGRCLPPELEPYVDIVSKIDLEKDLEM